MSQEETPASQEEEEGLPDTPDIPLRKCRAEGVASPEKRKYQTLKNWAKKQMKRR